MNAMIISTRRGGARRRPAARRRPVAWRPVATAFTLLFSRATLLSLLTLLIPLTGCRSSGQQYITVTIEQNGAPVLETGYGVSDSLGEEAWFEQLANASFSESTKLEVDEKDPSQVTLTGDLRIVMSHVESPLAKVRSAELRLEADPAMPGHWRLAPGEASRLRQLNKQSARY